MKVKIKERKSRLWKLWNILFPNADLDKVFIEFADTIWTPIGYGEIDDHYVEHEKVHFRQQKGSYFWATIWLIKYVFSKKFRYAQELPAYKHQLQFLIDKGDTKDLRLEIYESLRPRIAAAISSPTYGPMVSYEQAMKDLELEI